MQDLPKANDAAPWQHLRITLAAMKGVHKKLRSRTDAVSSAAQTSAELVAAYISDRLDIIASAAKLAAQCAEW